MIYLTFLNLKTALYNEWFIILVYEDFSGLACEQDHLFGEFARDNLAAKPPKRGGGRGSENSWRKTWVFSPVPPSFFPLFRSPYRGPPYSGSIDCVRRKCIDLENFP